MFITATEKGSRRAPESTSGSTFLDAPPCEYVSHATACRMAMASTPGQPAGFLRWRDIPLWGHCEFGNAVETRTEAFLTSDWEAKLAGAQQGMRE